MALKTLTPYDTDIHRASALLPKHRMVGRSVDLDGDPRITKVGVFEFLLERAFQFGPRQSGSFDTAGKRQRDKACGIDLILAR